MKAALLAHLRTSIALTLHREVSPLDAVPASGGCIHQSYVLTGNGERYFAKINNASAQEVFSAEALALETMAHTHAIRVPLPLCHGTLDDFAYLVLEHITLRRGEHASEQAAMGTQLAALHKSFSPDNRHGWPADNYIGATPQPNAWRDDWAVFWREQRLGWQLKLALAKGLKLRGGERLMKKLPVFFVDYQPLPSLLHGDLWGGNAGFDEQGHPVLYDPASYYGDRETDLAFTEMFGGFSAAFYQAYDAAWPRAKGWQQRRELYNLYHVLNHFNLFGGHYGAQAQRMLDQLNQWV